MSGIDWGKIAVREMPEYIDLYRACGGNVRLWHEADDPRSFTILVRACHKHYEAKLTLDRSEAAKSALRLREEFARLAVAVRADIEKGVGPKPSRRTS